MSFLRWLESSLIGFAPIPVFAGMTVQLSLELPGVAAAFDGLGSLPAVSMFGRVEVAPEPA
jgi:hypothetical protein